MKKRILSFILAAAMALSLTACGGSSSTSTSSTANTDKTDSSAASESTEAVHLTLAHADTETGSLFGECTIAFKEMVEEKSNGSIIIDIYPNGQLGTVSEYVTGIQNGSIDLAPAVSSYIANFCTDVSVFDMPFLFESYDHVWNTMDSEVGSVLTQELSDNGITALVWFGIGFRNVTTSESHPISSIDDLKGFRIRTMTSTIHQSLFQALGADAVPMDWGELYTALQQGTVDGEENPFGQILSSNIWEVNPMFVKTEHASTPAVFMMSPHVADKLSDEQMDIIYACAEECAPIFRQKSVDINNDALDTLINEKGCTYVETIEKSALQAATASVYDEYPQYSELVDSIRALA